MVGEFVLEETQMNSYKCPHCGKEIEEVRVIELRWKRILISCGLGFGVGMIAYPYFSLVLPATNVWVATIGAFVLAFTIVFLATMPKKAKKKKEK